MNFFTIVGRLKNDIIQEEKYYKMNIVVKRQFKDENDEYKTDELEVRFNDGLATAKDYCTEGCICGIKGRLQNEDGKIVLIAEKISFLSSNQDKGEEPQTLEEK